jgi:hypothetical protein
MNGDFGIMNFVVGTGVLYAVTYLLVVPITRALSRGAQPTPDRQADVIDQLPTGLFMAVSAVLLAIIGLAFGLAGYDIIGISKKGKMWPGLIVMMLCCIVGAVFHEGRFLGRTF